MSLGRGRAPAPSTCPLLTPTPIPPPPALRRRGRGDETSALREAVRAGGSVRARARGVHTRVLARLCGRICVYPCLCTRVFSCDPLEVPIQVCACCRPVEGDAWTVRVRAQQCAYVREDACPCG